MDQQIEVSGAAIEQAARACHEINRAYCQALGDHSQVVWEEAPANIQESARQGVLFHLMNPDAKPADSHNKWFEFKQKDGWVYGEVKDAEKKTHPCMVAYEQLPEAQRAKDYLFSATVKQIMRVLKESP